MLARFAEHPRRLEVDRLTKSFGSLVAVDDLSWHGRSGTIDAFLIWMALFLITALAATERAWNVSVTAVLLLSALGACLLRVLPPLMRRPPDLDALAAELQEALRPLFDAGKRSP